MGISLCKAGVDDAEFIHQMQVKAFMPLLEKYKDYETSPANESVEKMIDRINQSFTDYYMIKNSDIAVGGVRIVKKENNTYRVSPIFIMPEYQGMGIAQQVFAIIEQKYNDAKKWDLDSIEQEQRNCYLYEKVGYKRTEETKQINDKLTFVFYEKDMD
ncbi:GNAT superfamily N-acetyltransferase [Paenibacillus sp. PastF-3]|uniref:GNAT family N-acetyltransferase n=1 Tax=Paenibacillus sp. PastF-3 TaxID=2940626 RepID=UPI002475C345|nr:GNAT family N-acetyltransferase [Paenibacillus sp. PastF-3]MDH6369392.1 GNAT superfamily N-acetyltransferase [Paenibacillus sp. PastF-3]